MASIELQNISVEFPIYDVNARSFKKNFLHLATGGRVSQDAKKHIIVSALNKLSIRFAHGDRVGLIGHNGAGKSTLLRLLSGIYEPSSGNLIIEGHVSPMLDLMQGMQTELTGYENIYLRGIILGLTKEQIKAQVDQIAELTGLGDYLAMPIRTYSSGMTVRLAFAISSSLNPDILLIDEIFGAGDAEFMEKAKKKMITLLTQSSIVVMANHGDEILKEFCTKGLVLDSGVIKYFGPIEAALQFYHNENATSFL